MALTPEEEFKVLEGLAEGRSLRNVCLQEDMPSIWMVLRWLDKSPAFEQQYVRARQIQGETHFEEILDVAEKVKTGEIDPQSGRVVIDAMKWAASKMRPKVYGDKITQEHQGPDGGPVQIAEIRHTIIAPGGKDVP